MSYEIEASSTNRPSRRRMAPSSGTYHSSQTLRRTADSTSLPGLCSVPFQFEEPQRTDIAWVFNTPLRDLDDDAPGNYFRERVLAIFQAEARKGLLIGSRHSADVLGSVSHVCPMVQELFLTTKPKLVGRIAHE